MALDVGVFLCDDFNTPLTLQTVATVARVQKWKEKNTEQSASLKPIKPRGKK